MIPLHLFEGFGVELEYMIVREDDLSVFPLCDEVIKAEIGSIASDVEFEDISWSNELVLHVIELKTTNPVARLERLEWQFQEHVRKINAHLKPLGARLMPAAMHPWMDPNRETKLWPHEYSPIYETYNRIFDCRGHGWSNVQSTHLNLPFHGDEEFGRLHAAIRLILPLLPALAASSPIVESRPTGRLDNRLEFYRHSQKQVPSIAGATVPEPVFTRDDYDKEILQKTYREIAPHDPEGILQYEFLNSRGAIARFTRGSIEIRLLDVQECPAADLGILALIIAVLKGLIHEDWVSYEEQKKWPVEPLATIFLDAITRAEYAEIRNPEYLKVLGLEDEKSVTAGAVWRALADRLLPERNNPALKALDTILAQGTLSRRILKALPPAFKKGDIEPVYRRLCDCLAEGKPFLG